jgi:hypothetical protein
MKQGSNSLLALHAEETPPLKENCAEYGGWPRGKEVLVNILPFAAKLHALPADRGSGDDGMDAGSRSGSGSRRAAGASVWDGIFPEWEFSPSGRGGNMWLFRCFVFTRGASAGWDSQKGGKSIKVPKHVNMASRAPKGIVSIRHLGVYTCNVTHILPLHSLALRPPESQRGCASAHLTRTDLVDPPGQPRTHTLFASQHLLLFHTSC